MFEQDPGEFSIADTVRSMAREVGGSLERMLDHLELEEPAASFGIDPERAREWAETAGAWLRSHVEEAGEDLAAWMAGHDSEEEPDPAGRGRGPVDEPEESPFRTGPRGRRRAPQQEPPATDPLRGAAPSPLDVPTTDQGQALAALDSGRWTIEPGSDALASKGEGPGPSDALGLVRELRVRDWITADGELTLAGHHALSRWLDAVS